MVLLLMKVNEHHRVRIILLHNKIVYFHEFSGLTLPAISSEIRFNSLIFFVRHNARQFVLFLILRGKAPPVLVYDCTAMKGDNPMLASSPGIAPKCRCFGAMFIKALFLNIAVDWASSMKQARFTRFPLYEVGAWSVERALLFDFALVSTVFFYVHYVHTAWGGDWELQCRRCGGW